MTGRISERGNILQSRMQKVKWQGSTPWRALENGDFSSELGDSNNNHEKYERNLSAEMGTKHVKLENLIL